MDMATDLRVQMAKARLSAADVAAVVGRTRVTVSRWRTGALPIPLDCARVLYANGLLSADSILSIPDSGDAA